MKNPHLPLTFTELTDGLPVEHERRLEVHKIYLQLHREQLQKSLAETEAALGYAAIQEVLPPDEDFPPSPPLEVPPPTDTP